MDKTLPQNFIDKNLMLRFIISKKNRWYRHILLIGFSIVVLYHSEPEYYEPTETFNRIIMFLEVLFLAYFNMYYLVPRFLFRSKYGTYTLSIIGMILFLTLIKKIAIHIFEPYLLPYQTDDIGFLSFTFIILVLVVASASVKLFQQWISDTELINELERSKTSAELEQLKNQINPHFLFNMLNNANVLTENDPKKTSQVLMKLSDLLRYQLYDSARDKVFLTSDIHFLEDFLNLEKVRRDNFDFMISKQGAISGVQIPPLLFISFVENAVKHNNDSAKASYVNLFFDVRNNELFFKCINSKPAINAVSRSGGLGLVNVKRRLELLFPLSHELKIEDDPETYCVTLTLKL